MYSLVSGPVFYRKINFTYQNRHSLHLFGDSHGFRTECEEKSTPLPRFIQNTIEEHPDLDIDIILESSVAHESAQLSRDLIGYTEDHFNQYGCFMNPVHALCARQFPRAQFHPVDIRGDLVKDYIFIVQILPQLISLLGPLPFLGPSASGASGASGASSASSEPPDSDLKEFDGTQETWKDNIVKCIITLREITDILVRLLQSHANITTTHEKLIWISDILESRVIRVVQNHFVIPQYFTSLALMINVPFRNFTLDPTLDFNIDLYYYCIFHENAPRYMKTVLGIQSCDEELQRQLVSIIRTYIYHVVAIPQGVKQVLKSENTSVYTDMDNMILDVTIFCAMLMDIRILALVCSKPCIHAIIVAGRDHCTRLVQYITSNPLFKNITTSPEFTHPNQGQCVHIPHLTFRDDMPIVLPEHPRIQQIRNIPVFHLTNRSSLGKKKKRTKTCRKKAHYNK